MSVHAPSPQRSAPITPPGRWLVFFGLLLSVWGCGSYAHTSDPFRVAMGQSRPSKALAAVNEALGVDNERQLPSDQSDQTSLLLLERATILQALGDYRLSSRDFQLADQHLDVLDLSKDTLGNIGKYIFSDDATLYKAAPYEKVLLHSLNIINYLAQGETSGAKVEARRLDIDQKYLADIHGEDAELFALGTYLAGCAFEAAGEPQVAMRYYAQAHEAGGTATLDQAIRRLHLRTGARDSRIEDLLPDADERESAQIEGTGELLIVLQTGMTPYKVPQRLPIATALVYAHSPAYGGRLSRQERARLQTLTAKGAVKWVNYPELRASRTGRSGASRVRIGGREAVVNLGMDIEAAAKAEAEKHKGTVLVAALTRLLTRTVLGEVGEAASQRGTGSGLAGLLIGLTIEGTLSALDTPDTRSWVSLPARIDLARVQLPAGEHEVELQIAGRTLRYTVEVQAGGLSVLNASSLR